MIIFSLCVDIVGLNREREVWSSEKMTDSVHRPITIKMHERIKLVKIWFFNKSFKVPSHNFLTEMAQAINTFLTFNGG